MEPTYSISLPNGKILEFAEGDITLQDTDALVNAANSSLLGGGGVDGAIHRAGGPAILQQCRELRETRFPGGLPAGQAVATGAGKLRARYVIHTVGPVYRGGGDGEASTLASAYRQSMRTAEELRLMSVAFPSISTGAYGYPIGEAAPIAIHTVAESLKDSGCLQLVRFVLFGAVAFRSYVKAAQRIRTYPVEER